MPLGFYDYSVQDDLVCKVEIEDVPFFNAPIYLENKEQIGKIDEIFGNIRDYSVSIRLGENMKAGSFKKNQKVIIAMVFFSTSNFCQLSNLKFDSLLNLAICFLTNLKI